MLYPKNKRDLETESALNLNFVEIFPSLFNNSTDKAMDNKGLEQFIIDSSFVL